MCGQAQGAGPGGEIRPHSVQLYLLQRQGPSRLTPLQPCCLCVLTPSRLWILPFLATLCKVTPFPCCHASPVAPPQNLGMNTACHPLRGWGSPAVVERLMPMFPKRWVQCVSGGEGEAGWLRQPPGEREGQGKRGWSPRCQRGLGPAPPSPSTIHSLLPAAPRCRRRLAELVFAVLILHPLQPEPGKVLEHDVVVRGIVGIKFNEVGVHRDVCFWRS